MIFITKFPKPALITYLSVMIAAIGIGVAPNKPTMTALCMVLCAMADMLDGAFARRFKRTSFEKQFGVMIDSLADVLAFVALPVAFLFSISTSAITVAIAILYSLTAVTRLAVFSAETKPGMRIRYYRGLPVTMAGIIFPLTYTITLVTQSNSLTRSALLGAYVVVAVLFVANIKVTKP